MNRDNLLLILRCIKVMGGVIAGSLIFTQQYPVLTIIIGAIAAGANEIIMHIIKSDTHDSTNSPDAEADGQQI